MAVMGINKHLNSSIDRLYSAINTDWANLDDIILSLHPKSLPNTVTMRNKKNNGIYDYEPLFRLHSFFFFDSVWLCNDGQVRGERGAFTYHVHYNSDFPVNNSYFRLFEDYYHGYITNLDLDE